MPATYSPRYILSRPKSALNDLLFFSDEPLFESQRELGLLLAEKGLGNSSSNPAFLNQIVLGKKQFPTRWIPFLQEVVRVRAQEQGHNETSIQHMVALFGGNGVLTDVHHPLFPLFTEQAIAHNTLILNACPLELTDSRHDHREAQLAQDLVMAGLQVGRGYHYCLGTIDTARRLWAELMRVAKAAFGEAAESKMDGWAKDGLLRVSVVPDSLLLHPTVAYNTTSPSRLRIFVWHAPLDFDHCLAVPEPQRLGWMERAQRLLDTHAEPVPLH